MGSSLAFSLKEDPVICAKVCDESWVILNISHVHFLNKAVLSVLWIIKIHTTFMVKLDSKWTFGGNYTDKFRMIIKKIQVLYMSSSFGLLRVESPDFSQVEKERTTCKAEQNSHNENYFHSKWQPKLWIE